jgi:hypothetical protein
LLCKDASVEWIKVGFRKNVSSEQLIPFLKRYRFAAPWAGMDFYSNLAMLKADGSVKIIDIKVAVKTVDRTFLQGQSVELFRAAIKSQATRDPYERRLIGLAFRRGWIHNLKMHYSF